VGDAGRRHLAYQPALDGVRALAVAAVVVFHGGVAAVSGGFLGVDAFFVLSGFLITSLLLAERAGTGRIDLVAFWGRRARRLLPALLLMLVAVVGVGRWLMPPEELNALRWDALAAVAYVANWRMADREGDYFAATGAPSPLQHTWSLGIEEQFYLVWPLLVLGAIWLGPVLRRRLPVLARATKRPRFPVLFLACASGAVASAVLAAALFRTADVDRAYYGTDTRAVALLVGCGLAVLLAGRRPTKGAKRPVLAGLAVAGVLVTACLWAFADGGAPWLFRGGLTVAALAVAAVIAHAVLSPASWTAVVLSLPPLVWLGRISYGVYLWHWPLFGWLSAERTGLTGPALLGVRIAATLAVASASFYLFEQPLRTARWPRRSPRLSAGVAAAALAVSAVVAVAATAPPPVPPAPRIALEEALLPPPPTAFEPEQAAAPVPPMRRAGRAPGDKPRIAFMGDSVSWSLANYLPEQEQIEVFVRGVQGCGIARLPEIMYVGAPHTNYPGCDKWDARWRRNIRTDDPDVAVILLDRWELMDRKLDGRWQHVGDPAFDTYLAVELGLAIQIAGQRGAHVVLLTAPYTRRAERPDGGLWPEDDPARVDAWNRLLYEAAARYGASVIDLNAHVCPDGEFTWRIDGIRIRSDGLHFSPDGVQRWIAPWLLPQLAKLAVAGPSPTPSSTVDDGRGPYR
jgi:peptidoglycan/LPS O-acetylase OafA/YrhL